MPEQFSLKTQKQIAYCGDPPALSGELNPMKRIDFSLSFCVCIQSTEIENEFDEIETSDCREEIARICFYIVEADGGDRHSNRLAGR